MNSKTNRLPSDITLVIGEAYEFLKKNHEKDLHPIYRKRIYETFLKILPRDHSRVIGRLGILSATKVLPVWVAVRPEDQSPQEIINVASGVQHGLISQETASKFADESWETFDKLAAGPSNGGYLEWYVAFACLQALYEALGHIPFSEIELSEHDIDSDLDSWSCDSASWAVAAHAGGIWDPNSDPVKREFFWNWWLTEAIPNAWQFSVD